MSQGGTPERHVRHGQWVERPREDAETSRLADSALNELHVFSVPHRHECAKTATEKHEGRETNPAPSKLARLASGPIS